NANQRLIWKHQCSLWDRVNVAYQLQLTEVIQKARFKQRFAIVTALGREISDFCFCKMKAAQKIDDRRQAAGDGELAAERVFPKRDVERSVVVAHPSFPVAASHRDLVKIGRQRGEIVRA